MIIPRDALKTVRCPVCHQEVPLGIAGVVIGQHPQPGRGRQKGCTGEGTPIVELAPAVGDV